MVAKLNSRFYFKEQELLIFNYAAEKMSLTLTMPYTTADDYELSPHKSWHFMEIVCLVQSSYIKPYFLWKKN